jgi:hypothetical protein
MLKRSVKRRVNQLQKPKTVFDEILAESESRGMGHQLPPLFGHVAIYFYQQSMSLLDAQSFFRHHERLEWKTVTGKPQKNWKVLATDWIYNAIQQTKLLERQEAKRTAFPDT